MTATNQLNDVFCFDLFGTLIAAPEGTPSYEQLFSEHLASSDPFFVQRTWRTKVIQAYVRRHFMAGPAPDLGYLEMAKQLCRGLSGLFLNEDLPLPERVADLWEAENQALVWLPGMKQVLIELGRLESVRLVLITNITHAALKQSFVQEVLSYFDDAYLSCHELCAKPDPFVWEWVMDRHPAAKRYWMYGDSRVNDLAVPTQMHGWVTANPHVSFESPKASLFCSEAKRW